jgi:hypothetical protein
MSHSVWRLPDDGTCIAVLANCHVTEGGCYGQVVWVA